MPICMICGYQHDDSVVHHINTKHQGGLSAYRLFFSQPVVSSTVYRNVENSITGSGPVDEDLIADIKSPSYY